MPADDFQTIRMLFAKYPPSFLGLCYDSGHGNIGGNGLAHLAEHRERLLAVHLHDNDGGSDQLELPFTGSIPWLERAGLLASSAYTGCVSLESNMRGQAIAEDAYLDAAYAAAAKLADMIAQRRTKT